MILCARIISRSREQSTKRRSHSENMRKVCLSYSQNKKMVWLSNMADTSLKLFTWSAKVCGLFFLDCAFRVLIGWTGKLRSRGDTVPCGKKNAGNQKALGWSRAGLAEAWLDSRVELERRLWDLECLADLTRSSHPAKKSTRFTKLSTQAPSGLHDSYAACWREQKQRYW